MKKIRIIVVGLLLTSLFLTSCSNTANENPTEPSAVTEEDSADTGAVSLAVAIVSSPSGVDDGSFNQNNYEGIKNFIANSSGSTVKDIQEPSSDPASSVKAVADIIADYDVVVTPGFQFSGVSTIASENPSKKFILIDTAPEVIGEQTEFDNILSMTFAEEESGFFAGVVAALETKTNKVAMVGGSAFPPVVNYHLGFNSGVNYVNKVYGKNVEIVQLAPYAGLDYKNENIGGNYVGSFDDEPTGKVIGNALVKEGADIIFVAAGNSGNGVFTAVKESTDAMVIGCDVDQFDDGVSGSKNIILTSALKIMDLNVERALVSIADGTFVGGNKTMKADTNSTGITTAAGRHQMKEETVTIYEEVFEMVKNATIIPAASFNGLTPEDFVGLPK